MVVEEEEEGAVRGNAKGVQKKSWTEGRRAQIDACPKCGAEEKQTKIGRGGRSSRLQKEPQFPSLIRI